MRDLLDEAKKRIVLVLVCVVGLSYLMSRELFDYSLSPIETETEILRDALLIYLSPLPMVNVYIYIYIYMCV